MEETERPGVKVSMLWLPLEFPFSFFRFINPNIPQVSQSHLTMIRQLIYAGGMVWKVAAGNSSLKGPRGIISYWYFHVRGFFLPRVTKRLKEQGLKIEWWLGHSKADSSLHCDTWADLQRRPTTLNPRSAFLRILDKTFWVVCQAFFSSSFSFPPRKVGYPMTLHISGEVVEGQLNNSSLWPSTWLADPQPPIETGGRPGDQWLNWDK